MPFVWSVRPREPNARPDAAVNPKSLKKSQLFALLDLEKSQDVKIKRESNGSLSVWSVRMQWRYERSSPASETPAPPAALQDP